MSISDIKKTNNPDIIDIVSLYITNMDELDVEGGYEKANKVLDLIAQKRTQIFNLSRKMKDEGIWEKYCSKQNYPQLNQLEKILRTALEDNIRKTLTDPNTGRLLLKKFNDRFLVFAEDAEIKRLGRNAVDASRNAEDKKGFARLNRGNIESDGKAVDELVEKMVEMILSDPESYTEYIFTCKTPINLDKVYLNLNSYFQEEIVSMQRFALQHGSTTQSR